ncbi:MAG: hypothetical protein Q9168_004140 [Polycauliona sp. 1 TL-2023]
MSDKTNPSNPMTQDAASRIQSATDKQGGDSGKGSWPANAQSKAAETANKSASGGGGGNAQGQGQGQQGGK